MNSGPESSAAATPTTSPTAKEKPLAREVSEATETPPDVGEENGAAVAEPVHTKPELVSLHEEHETDPTTETAQERRFLGGDVSATAFKPAWPSWFRVFLIATFLAVNFAALCALLLYPFAGNAAKPTVRCLVVGEYTSPAIPVLEFAQNDAARLLGLSSIAEAEQSSDFFHAHDVNDIQAFFDQQLRVEGSSTCVVYVALHGFGDANGARLLPADANAIGPNSGFDIARMLDAIETSKTRNTVVLLDSNRFQENLRLGCQQNDFAAALKRTFESRLAKWNNDPDMAGRNVLVLNSASDQQTASTSAALKGSPFALVASYCLAGGSKADFADNDSGEADGEITARELCRYCTETVANWSLDNRGRSQVPQAVWFGEDFAIAATDDAVTVAGIMDPSSISNTLIPAALAAQIPGADTATDPAAKTPEAPAAEPAAAESPKDKIAAAPAEDKPAEEPRPPAAPEPPSIDELFATVLEHRDANELSSNAPATWIENQQLFAKVELLLVADERDRAETVLTRWQDKRDLAAELSVPLPESANDSNALAAVLANPTDDNLKALQADPCFEGELLLPLAQRFRRGDRWLNPDAMELASTVRSLFLQTGDINRWAFRFVREPLDAADQSRIQAEVELFDGRFDQATKLLTRAAAGFRDAITDANHAAAAFDEIDAAVVSLPWLVTAANHSPQQANASRIVDFTRSLKQFCKAPTVSRLRLVSAAARRVQAFGNELTMNAVSSTSRENQLALLSLPGLRPEARTALFEALRESTDKSDFRVGHRSGRSRSASPQISDAQQALVQFFNGKIPPDRSLTELVNAIRAGDSCTDTNSNLWTRRMLHLASSYWAPISRPAMLQYRVDSESLTHESTATQLTWRVASLKRTHHALPIRSRETLTASVSELRELQPAYQTQPQQPTFILAGTVTATDEESDQQVSVPLAVTVTKNLPAGAEAVLVVQSFPPRELTIDGERSNSGRFEIPLEDLVRGSNRNVLVEVANSPESTTLTTSVRLSTGEIVWKSHSLGPVQTKVPVAELDIKWPDNGPTAGVAEIMPNESLPIQIGIRKTAADVTGLSLELIGDKVVTIPVVDSKLLFVDIKPGPGFTVPVSSAGLTLRLLHNNEVLTERTINPTVMDPSQCFRYDVTLDSTRNRVIGRVEQLYQSDAQGPVSFKFGLQDAKGHELPLPSSQSLRLDTKTSSGQLEAAMPFSVPQPYHVSIGAAGVPRALRYVVRSTVLTGERDQSGSLTITNPASGTRYAANGKLVLPVTLRADTPQRDAKVFVGIDQNQNGVLEQHERMGGGQYWFGRDSTLALVMAGKPAALQLKSVVQDITINLDVTGYEGYLPLIASIEEFTVAKADIHLLKSAPQLAIVWPTSGGVVPAAKSMRVTVQGDGKQVSAIDNVEFGFDLNQNGKFDANEVVGPVKASKFKPNGRATVELPTAKLKEGAVTVFTRTKSAAIDADGKPVLLTSEVSAATADYVTKGTISGRVQLVDGTPVNGATITIAGGAAKRTGADGSYEFRGVQPGMHVLSASAPGRLGSQGVKVQPARLTKADITILVR